jgi:hypothetical protein
MQRLGSWRFHIVSNELPGRSRDGECRDELPRDDAAERGSAKDEDRSCAQERIRGCLQRRRQPDEDGCDCCGDRPSDDPEEEIRQGGIESTILTRAKTVRHR